LLNVKEIVALLCGGPITLNQNTKRLIEQSKQPTLPVTKIVKVKQTKGRGVHTF